MAVRGEGGRICSESPSGSPASAACGTWTCIKVSHFTDNGAGVAHTTRDKAFSAAILDD